MVQLVRWSYREWRRWFAWRPVGCEGERVWLEWLEWRKRSVYASYRVYNLVEYRFLRENKQ